MDIVSPAPSTQLTILKRDYVTARQDIIQINMVFVLKNVKQMKYMMTLLKDVFVLKD